MTRAVVDADACACTGMCVRVAPRIFELPAGAAAARVLISALDDADLVREAEEAAEACPTAAITIRHDV